MPAFGRAIRRRFALEPGWAFINHGSFGTAPRVVLAAAQRWRSRMEANPDYFLREVMPGALRSALLALSRFLGVEQKDLAFVENATAGVSAVLRSLELRRGDEIVSTTHTYPAVREALRYVCARSGAKLVEARIELPVVSSFSLEQTIMEKFKPSTRLVVLDHISSPTGLIFPVKRIAREARRRGIRVLVDGAHAPGQLPLDVGALGVDWYTGNCHKWLFAARGCGFLWAHPRVQETLQPTAISRDGDFATRFDWTGTRDFSAWLAVTDGIDFFRELNPAKVRQHNHVLVTSAAKMLSAAWDTPVDGPAELHGSLMAIRMPRAFWHRDPRRLLADTMARHRTVFAPMQIGGALWARISAQVYNVPQDYERLRRLVAPPTR